MRTHALTALSPLDGRYASQTSDLSLYFSEFAVIKARLIFEIEYLLFLSQKKIIPEFTPEEKLKLTAIAEDFLLPQVKKVKEIEAEIHHDVKAVEYFLQRSMAEVSIKNAEYVHIALTSEDVNNCVYSLALQNSLQHIIFPQLKELIEQLCLKAEKTKNHVMLAKTHGQPAVPTTMGKELVVFALRLAKGLKRVSNVKIEAKMTGAVGNFNAHTVAFAQHDWFTVSQEFIEHLGLQPQLYTTQILLPDSYVQTFNELRQLNSILLDLNQDIWRYISDGVFVQTAAKGHVGSSTMPQKVNPIDFENSEGNLGLANALLYHFSEKLPISRLQRDLSDSTVKRNFGVALAHCLLAYTACLKGLQKIEFNANLLAEQLDAHWEVVTEGIQTILRTTGDEKAYDKLKEFSRGKVITQQSLTSFIESLDINLEAKIKLQKLTPSSYVGLAKELTERGLTEVRKILNKT